MPAGMFVQLLDFFKFWTVWGLYQLDELTHSLFCISPFWFLSFLTVVVCFLFKLICQTTACPLVLLLWLIHLVILLCSLNKWFVIYMGFSCFYLVFGDLWFQGCCIKCDQSYQNREAKIWEVWRTHEQGHGD